MATLSPLAMLTIATVVIVGAIAIVAYSYTKMTVDRRAVLARMLGRAFAFLIAGSMLLGLIVQFGR
jgi:hypothetical protein